MSYLRRIFHAFFFVASIGGTTLALAGPSGDRVPTYIEITADGAIIIEGAWDNPENCMHPYRIFIPADNVHIDKYYAAALAAIVRGRPIWAWVEGCQWMPWPEEYSVVKNIAIR